MSGLMLASVSMALLVGLVASWMTMMKRVQIEGRRWVLRLIAVATIVCAGFAFAQGVGWLGGTLAGVSLGVSALFVILSSFARQSIQTPAVAVGQPMPEFSAPDENGEIFESKSLAGKPMLLKFFRGHW